MLGWFKKKFSKNKDNVAPVEEQVQETVITEELPASQIVTEEAAIAEESISEEPSVVEEPIGDEASDTEESVVEETPVSDEPVAEESPDSDEPVAEDSPDSNEPVAEESPISDEPVAEESSDSDEPVAEESPDSDEPVAEESPVSDEPVAEESPVSDEPVAEESSDSDEPVAEESPDSDEPVVEESPDSDEPVSDGSPVDESPSETEEAPEVEKTGIGSMFQRLSTRLSMTKESLVYRMDTLFMGSKEIDADLFDELEEILITADLGISTTIELLDDARKRVKRNSLSDPKELRSILKEKLRSFIMESDKPAELVMPKKGPFVIMVVGVNGVGKTTTIGKITKKFKRAGQSVLLVAADTFRAAAVAQLKIWGERNEVDVVHQQEGADPSAVAFDAMDQAVAGGYDVVIVDTAGRLHTQVNLMEELKKIKRVMGKRLKGAPHEILLVLDATTGQNAVSQAKLFDAAVDITGLALTKLDGTAKGGIVASICRELAIPIRFIGIGEQIDDLRDFDADEFIDALFGEDSYKQ